MLNVVNKFCNAARCNECKIRWLLCQNAFLVGEFAILREITTDGKQTSFIGRVVFLYDYGVFIVYIQQMQKLVSSSMQ